MIVYCIRWKTHFSRVKVSTSRMYIGQYTRVVFHCRWPEVGLIGRRAEKGSPSKTSRSPINEGLDDVSEGVRRRQFKGMNEGALR